MFRKSIAAAALVVLGASSAPAQSELPPVERQLSLTEAIGLALKNNLNLQVSRIEPELSELRIQESEGAYDPSLTGGASYARNKNPIASPVQAAFGTSGNVIVEDTYDYNGGFIGRLPWGFEWSSLYDITRLETSSSFNALRPEWRAGWRSELTVPLLKDLYWNDVDLAVRRSRVQRDVSDEEFREQLNDTIALIEAAYWNLTAARESEKVSEKSLETARAVLEQTQVQYEVGVVSKVNVAQADAGVAEREFNAIVRRNDATAAQDSLLNSILAPSFQEFRNTTLVTQAPTFVAYSVDSDEAMAKAFERRPELGAARARVVDAELQLAHAWNQRLPSLDLKGSYAANAIAGDPRPGVALAGIDSAGVNKGLFEGDSGSWSIGATVDYPLGNDTARSRHTQRQIELRRARTRLRQTEQDVIIDVRNAVRELRNSIDAVKAAERNVAARTESLRAEQERLRLGDSTPRNVLEVEEDLAEAEQQEIGALQRYAIAITALERAQSTLLDTRGISVVDELNRDRD